MAIGKVRQDSGTETGRKEKKKIPIRITPYRETTPLAIQNIHVESRVNEGQTDSRR
jgi:hypothetical protein